MESKGELLNHFKTLRAGVNAVGGEAYFNLETFEVEVRLGNVVVRLYPQFVVVRDGKMDYVRDFPEDAWRFAGWRANRYTRFATLIEKLGFKKFAVEKHVPTPRYALVPEHKMDAVIVKRSISTFGYDIRGPFTRSTQSPLDLEKGDYYEEFKPGRIVKLWFWMDQPVSADLKHMPSVVGDGVSTIKALIQQLPTKPGRPVEFERISNMLRIGSLDFESVLPEGKHQVVDYVYTSVLDNPAGVEEVMFANEQDSPSWAAGLTEIGKTIWAQLSSEGWGMACYTLDAILDEEGHLWFLEFNPNPFIHPSVYRPMMQSLQQNVLNNAPILVAGSGAA